MLCTGKVGVAHMQSVKGVALGSLDKMGNWLSKLKRLYTLGQDSSTCNVYETQLRKNCTCNFRPDVKYLIVGLGYGMDITHVTAVH